LKTTKLEKRVIAFLDKIYAPTSKQAQETQTRALWKNDVEHIINGAAGEFFKCRIHDKIKAAHKDRKHWEIEWRYHLGQRLSDQLKRKTTFSDLTKAAKEAFQDHASVNHRFRTGAANTMADYLGGSKVKFQKILTDQDIKDFYTEVGKALDAGFGFDAAASKQEVEPAWNAKPGKSKRKS
jgi:hypothetical protein